MSQLEPGVSVVLLARNEARRLKRWFEAVTRWATEIIVVDSGSTDQTAEIARRYTDKVYPVSNKLNFDINKNYAFALATCEWILSLDADEIPTPELIDDLQAKVRDPHCRQNGFNVMIHHFALGEVIHPPTKHLRLFRNGLGGFPGESVHQVITVPGEIGLLKGHVDHFTYDSIYERVEKTNIYSESMAAHWYHSGQPFRLRDMIWQPIRQFLKVYFYRGGYKHGVLGLFSSLDGSYSVFLRYVKLWSAYKLGHFPAPNDEFPPQERR
jgi:glycosyltransferase involved in cell wall biosynthesis